MIPPARKAFIAKHLPDHANLEELPKLEIMIHSSEPSWKLNNKKYKTYAISITCPRPQKDIIMHLMTEIYPGVPSDEFDDSPVYKFIPYSFPYDKSVHQPEQSYVNLIHEQNTYLYDNIAIPVVGISEDSMQ